MPKTLKLSPEIDPKTVETMREKGIRLESASADRMGDVMDAFSESYVDFDPCWRATGFWENQDSLFYKYALWEARSVLYKDVASSTSVVAVDEAGDIVGMILGRPISRYVHNQIL